MFNFLFLAITGISFGILTSAGVFTVLIAVGLVPRFAGKTHTSRYVFLYEEAVIFGTVTGCFISIFPEYSQAGAYLRQNLSDMSWLWDRSGIVVITFFGLFSGMFVGCLALAIAEMLDSIPIFARRISLRHGIGLVGLSIAIGKVMGALMYFVQEMHKLPDSH